METVSVQDNVAMEKNADVDVRCKQGMIIYGRERRAKKALKLVFFSHLVLWSARVASLQRSGHHEHGLDGSQTPIVVVLLGQ